MSARSSIRLAVTWALLISLAAGSFRWVTAQEAAPAEPAPPAAGTPPAATPAAESLPSRQEALALRYQRFEATLLQLAEYLRKTDPDRAELLVRAIGKSKEQRIQDQLGQLVELLKQQKLGDAIEGQETAVAEMMLVLQLLQSEDRKDEIEREKARIRDLIKDVNKLVLKQTDVRAATEKGGSDKLPDQQRDVADATQKVMDKIDAQDAAKQANANGKPGENGKPGKPSGKPGEEKPEGDKPEGDMPKDPNDKPADPSDPSGSGKEGSGKPGSQGKPKDPMGKPKDPMGKPMADGDKPPMDGDKPPMDGDKPADAGMPSDSSGKPMPGKGKPMPGQSGPPMPSDGSTPPMPPPGDDGDSPPPQGGNQDSQPQSQQNRTAGRKELEQAKREMEDAIEELKKKQLNKASDKQDQALAELLKAKERLEEILRQLREEEKELMLAALEARFRDMLARQINVYNGSVAVAAVPAAQRTDKHRGRSIELARSEDEIALLAAKVLTLLKEEGSSIAFPEAVLQLREDMLIVARRLERGEVEEVTLGIEKDIIESLEEILEALQKELEKSKDKKQQPPPPPGQPQDQALVDALAELKMLRSLQYRVNRRTKQLGRLVEGEQANDADLIQQLRGLSARQAKIQQNTYDLATGRNR